MSLFLKNSTKQAQQKVLASVGFSIELKHIPAAVERISSFAQQKALIAMDSISLQTLFDCNKNETQVKSISDIYEDFFFSSIKDSFLRENKEQINSFLNDLIGNSIHFEEIFKFVITNSFIKTMRENSFGSYLSFSSYLYQCTQLLADDDLWEYEQFVIEPICDIFFKKDIASFGFLFDSELSASSSYRGINKKRRTVLIENELTNISFELLSTEFEKWITKSFDESFELLQDYSIEFDADEFDDLNDKTYFLNFKNLDDEDKKVIINWFYKIKEIFSEDMKSNMISMFGTKQPY